jgi:hypothetical protein
MERQTGESRDETSRLSLNRPALSSTRLEMTPTIRRIDFPRTNYTPELEQEGEKRFTKDYYTIPRYNLMLKHVR